MKIISTDNHHFYIYENGVNVFDDLPKGFYSVNYSQMEGFFLESHQPIIVDQKLYGPHEAKVDKIIRSYKRVKTNLGVILSGDKGLGKSLAARLIVYKLANDNYPIIIINKYIQGIANFLHSLPSNIVILFDEFDKLFKNNNDEHEKSANPQEEMLSLFDGIDERHRLFIITANHIRKINEFFINRPGRFQYHLIFQYPSDEDIKIYLNDNLIDKEMISEIPKVQKFARKVPISYDSLNAICFELNSGLLFEEAIQDLNILNLDEEEYNIILTMSDGSIFKTKYTFNTFSDIDETLWIESIKGDVKITFTPSDIIYSNGLYLDPSKLIIDYSSYENEEEKEHFKTLKAVSVKFVKIFKNYHFNL